MKEPRNGAIEGRGTYLDLSRPLRGLPLETAAHHGLAPVATDQTPSGLRKRQEQDDGYAAKG